MPTSSRRPFGSPAVVTRRASVIVARLVAGVAIGASATAAQASVHSWTGAGATANWTNPFNWFEVEAPNTADDSVFFFGPNIRSTSVVNQSFTLKSIYFVEGDAGEEVEMTINRENNAVLTLSGAIENNLPRTQTFNVPIALANDLFIFNPADGANGDGGGRIVFNESLTPNGHEIIVEPKAGSTIELNGPIVGSGRVEMSGLGTLKLGGSSSFTDGLSIFSGRVVTSDGPNVGARTSPIKFLAASGEVAVLQRTTGGTNVSPIQFSNGGEGQFDTTGNGWTLTGSISGDGTLGMTGGGSLSLTGQLSYLGATRVHAGSLTVSENAYLPNSTRVYLNPGTNLNYVADHSDTIGSLDGAGRIFLGDGTKLTIGTAGTSRMTGEIRGTGGSIGVAGSSTLLLTGANLYTGGTTIQNTATLIANNTSGSATGTGTVIVQSGTRLAGDGNVSGVVTVAANGTIAPSAAVDGTGIGTLGVGSLSLSSGAKIRLELRGLAAGTDADQLNVAGSANLAGATLELVALNGFVSSPGFSSSIIIGGTRMGTFANVTGSIVNPTTALAVTYDVKNVYVSVARPGDATLDGSVNFDDLLVLAQNYGGTTGTNWTRADFDGKAGTTFDDLLLLAKNYGFNLLGAAPGSASIGVDVNSAAFVADWALAQSLVPEPTSLGLLAAGLCLTRRRR